LSLGKVAMYVIYRTPTLVKVLCF